MNGAERMMRPGETSFAAPDMPKLPTHAADLINGCCMEFTTTNYTRRSFTDYDAGKCYLFWVWEKLDMKVFERAVMRVLLNKFYTTKQEN